MHGGNTSEAMEDFTGGLTEFLELGTYNPLPYLFRIIEKSNERRSLMACSIDASPDQMEADGPFGLVLGHAYSVTDVKRFVHVSKAEGPRQLQLLRLRNPWGNDREWYGPWSDRSNEWNGISASERKRIGLVFEHDGEFWMSMEDFLRYFSHLEFCHLGPESLGLWHTLRQDPNMRRWEMTRMEGEWIRYASAGGCRNYEGSTYI
ncbi:unnamed protein product [Dicrocoelium dendriticum]|nr:unnamed protein product [Dicrocoelium dendriticum]